MLIETPNAILPDGSTISHINKKSLIKSQANTINSLWIGKLPSTGVGRHVTCVRVKKLQIQLPQRMLSKIARGVWLLRHNPNTFKHISQQFSDLRLRDASTVQHVIYTRSDALVNHWPIICRPTRIWANSYPIHVRFDMISELTLSRIAQYTKIRRGNW